jgi:WD40 repeat protein
LLNHSHLQIDIFTLTVITKEKQIMKDYTLGVILTIITVAVVGGTGLYLYFGDHQNKPATEQEENAATKVQDKKDREKEMDEEDEFDDVIESGGEDETANAPSTKVDEAPNIGTCLAGKVLVQKTWLMPKILKEISSIAWLGQDHIAAVQDNDGIIFIYNLLTEKVEQELKFGPQGDYEGLTYAHGNFFVSRSDGFIIEVNAKGKVLNEYDLPLTATDNTEPFYFDASKNRLLIGQKDGAKGAKIKSFYSFDLGSRKFNPQAVYTIKLDDPIVSCSSDQPEKGKKAKKKHLKKSTIRPSELAINPQSKEIFIADGPNQRILVLSPQGKPKYYLSVDKKIFPQVEGILFSPEGDFYISTEGLKDNANISKVTIKLD